MLYIIPTPIGNLGDITVRSIETLKTIPLVIAENPPHTKKLLKLLEIADKKVMQFAEHNEQKQLPVLMELLQTQDAVLVTDAGTPALSDPGFRLVRACRENSIEVTSLPGAFAGSVALSGSGLPTDKFWFVGFLPKTEPKLTSLIEQTRTIDSTLVGYESPKRLLKTLERLTNIAPTADIVVARELTKLHEEYCQGTAVDLLEQFQNRASIKGEITILISCK